jgi:hypothetical protein
MHLARKEKMDAESQILHHVRPSFAFVIRTLVCTFSFRELAKVSSGIG